MASEPHKGFPHSPFTPFDPDVSLYEGAGWTGGQDLVPWEHTGWRDEVLSWKKTAYIHGHLNPTTTYRVSGPDALRFFADHCVNSFEKFPIGSSKHAIMCNDAGKVVTHGVLLRMAEDDFMTYWLAPWVSYCLEKDPSAYDAVGEDLTGTKFLFQIAGPNSIYILEKATEGSLRDIRFLRHREATVAGADVRVLRLGMAGTLAYELHGSIEDALKVYNAVLEAGADMGIRRLGIHAYMMNHTENGFPQAGLHFLGGAGEEAEEEVDLMAGEVGEGGGLRFWGSAADDPELFFRSPVELGWGKQVRLDHEFKGRAALEAELENPPGKTVTLVWNRDDLADLFKAQFGEDVDYLPMELSDDHPNQIGHARDYSIHMDRVFRDGEMVGVSSGRINSRYYREMISLGIINVEHAELGTELTVLWGDPGGPQKELRATVERFPFLDLPRNEKIDVTTLPESFENQAVTA